MPTEDPHQHESPDRPIWWTADSMERARRKREHNAKMRRRRVRRVRKGE